jgi:hypothetical protein
MPNGIQGKIRERVEPWTSLEKSGPEAVQVYDLGFTSVRHERKNGHLHWTTIGREGDDRQSSHTFMQYRT